MTIVQLENGLVDELEITYFTTSSDRDETSFPNEYKKQEKDEENNDIIRDQSRD